MQIFYVHDGRTVRTAEPEMIDLLGGGESP